MDNFGLFSIAYDISSSYQLHHSLLASSGKHSKLPACPPLSVKSAGCWLLQSLNPPGLRNANELFLNESPYLNQVLKITLPPLFPKLHRGGDFCLFQSTSVLTSVLRRMPGKCVAGLVDSVKERSSISVCILISDGWVTFLGFCFLHLKAKASNHSETN